ncbi:cupin domain-containing protein [Sphingomonas sp. MMS24-J13]|uniref:cupin domain-containing protein n=1 Tax=Sphingomonas sp. MMS24-J13 TaxID=3238686 RepID=UPI00384A5764
MALDKEAIAERYPRLRRVVTGHDAAGKSIVLIDGFPTFHGDLAAGSWGVQDIWESDVVPAPIDATERDPTDGPVHFGIPNTGVRVRITDIPPSVPGAEPFMHRTNSIDYLHVLEGEIVMLLDDADHEVVLRRGDTIVQRATNHAWVNRSGAHCRVLVVMVAGRITDDLEKIIGPMPPWPPHNPND